MNDIFKNFINNEEMKNIKTNFSTNVFKYQLNKTEISINTLSNRRKVMKIFK